MSKNLFCCGKISVKFKKKGQTKNFVSYILLRYSRYQLLYILGGDPEGFSGYGQLYIIEIYIFYYPALLHFLLLLISSVVYRRKVTSSSQNPADPSLSHPMVKIGGGDGRQRY